MKANKILFITQEIVPFTESSPMADTCKDLLKGAQERGHEIRTFMPKWGNINERRNQLHEVIRLTGMNIIVDDTDHPLIIKVASMPSLRTQVFFILNDDYFRNHLNTRDENGNEYPDNDERTIFFARSVLETVKKQSWYPDTIHCHGWISHILPLYLKKSYIDDPIFSNSKIVLSLYDDIQNAAFPSDFKEKVLFNGVNAEDVDILTEPSGINLAKLAASYSDGIILGSDKVSDEIISFCSEAGLPILNYNAEAIENG